MEDMSAELLELCLKFAKDIGWSEASGQAGLPPHPGQRPVRKPREKRMGHKTFDTSSEEDYDATWQRGPRASGAAGPSQPAGGAAGGTAGGELTDATQRLIARHVQEFLTERWSLCEPGTPREEDALDYWARNSARWPIVAWVARHSLCVPAGSGASERGFSVSGHTVRSRRASLGDERIEQLTFLSGNTDL
ncbi:unnamed protein product [Ostreobium quekettii]|uniref:HAT C-terminal dimerisation domain-containing protein n=1 Tax=Ostreobium quekettii TaxID=121088 RepID=A0A8S1IKI5_9CHLO|nr:unnamed protein product [Ostreobium quekettii]